MVRGYVEEGFPQHALQCSFAVLGKNIQRGSGDHSVSPIMGALFLKWGKPQAPLKVTNSSNECARGVNHINILFHAPGRIAPASHQSWWCQTPGPLRKRCRPVSLRQSSGQRRPQGSPGQHHWPRPTKRFLTDYNANPNRYNNMKRARLSEAVVNR